MGVGHHVRVDIGGRVVLASCHRRLFARRIGLVPIRQSQRLAYDRGLAHGDPDRRIFKVEWIYEQEMYRDKEQAINEINRMIDFYNNRRPHMSIGMECPMEVYKGKLPGKNLWRKRP